MYHPAIIARNQARLEQVYRAAFPKGLVRYPVDVCAAMVDRLAQVVDDQGRPTRRLTPQEDHFVANERLLTKIDYRYAAERYHWCNSEGQGLKRLFPLWESQTIILDRLAALQLERAESGHPDGLLFNILKARQLGASTFCASLGTHRVTTHTHVRALLASDVPDNAGSEGLFGMYERYLAHLPWFLKPQEQFHTKNQHVIFENGSALLVEAGKSMKGGLQDEGGQKGNMGRSKTFSVVHLTELSTWERPEQIDDGLMPAVPRTPRTLGMKESTAKGRHNWHHEDWLLGSRGKGRFLNVFIPWYAEQSKYWLPPPVDWSPDPDTLAHAQKAEREGPKWLGRPVTLTRHQLYWYEETRGEYVAKNKLAKFLEEYAADPEECFQHSGRSIFGIEQLQYLERIAKPLIDCWSVDPAKDLDQIRSDELVAIKRQRELEAAARAEEAARARDRDPLVGVDGR